MYKRNAGDVQNLSDLAFNKDTRGTLPGLELQTNNEETC